MLRLAHVAIDLPRERDEAEYLEFPPLPPGLLVKLDLCLLGNSFLGLGRFFGSNVRSGGLVLDWARGCSR